MYRNLFKHSLRALTRQKTYVIINILGLATGIACSLVISLFILHELSFDRYHENKDRIHQVVLNGKIGGREIIASSTTAILGATMVNEFPEVSSFLRMNFWGETILKHDEKFYTEDRFVEVDSTFFAFFSIPLLRGQADKVLNEPYTLVLSESTARKIFGEEDPIDKMLRVGTSTELYRVTGVMQDIPANTHFEANVLGSFMTNSRANDPTWLSNSFSTYVLLHPGADPQRVNERFYDMIVKYVGPELYKFMGISIEEFLGQGNRYNYELQPLTAIHLNPAVYQDQKAPNDPKYLWIFGSVGLLIIVIAAVNFMNLSTAQAAKRAKEVGVKKVSGSTRGALIGQFLAETLILAFVALALAVMLTELALPYVNNLLNLNLRVGYFSLYYVIPVLILFAAMIGILAGIYPAFYLSSFNPVKVLKGKVLNRQGKFSLRSILTILQFTISIILIVGTLIMHRQLQYMISKDLGFEKEHIIVIRRATVLGNQVNAFREELRALPGVLSVSASTAVPGHSNNNNGFRIQGRDEESFLFQTTWADYDFLETYGMKLADGRNFDREMATDRMAVIINERSVRNYNLQDPLSTRIIGFHHSSDEPSTFHVIGVLRDYHFESLRSEISPCVLQFKDENINWGYVSIRLAPTANAQTLEDVEKVWATFTASEPMLWFFLDKDFERMYQEEKQNASLSVLFTILAIFIASIGLYGLTAFTIAQRTKEIGVRKTFGASIWTIWFMMSREMLSLVLIATAIAWPLVYWVADNWLQNYAYRIQLNPIDFLAGFLIAVGIAIATLSYRTLKAASVNPSISLRYE